MDERKIVVKHTETLDPKPQTRLSLPDADFRREANGPSHKRFIEN